MMPFRFGCQTYTWEMLGHRWKGTPDEILDTVAETGYQGVEFSNAMIGCYGRHPAAFREALAARGLDCAAFAYARTGFTDPTRWEEDLEGAVEALRFCVAVDALLCLGGPAAPSRDHYETDFAQAVRFYNEVALRGADLGVTVCVHPHSHHGSLVESAEEYARL
ncbi:MAG TPA: sugar phosphate isomerase/epimerase, partial [Armatimonadota bacterium]|nr:sugar phosphate isomerase/epimerase [Armatimonadota bacterium]